MPCLRRRNLWLVLAAFGAALAPRVAGGLGESTSARESGTESEDDTGLWPTAQMVENLLRRWAASTAEEYELTDDQREKLEAQLLEHWPPFLQAHRNELQPLVNEYLETRLSMEPPPKERVQAWAARGLPVFDKIRAHVGQGNDRFASILTARQRLKFEVQRAKGAVEFEVFRGRLKSWEQGEFKESEWWEIPSAERKRRRAEEARAASRPADSPDPADPLEEELAAWDEFVASFCDQYDLDDTQRASARSILEELKARANDYRSGRREEIVRLEARIAQPEAGQDLQQTERELEQIYGPVDAMFRELETRLRRLTTDHQRRQAGEAVSPAPPGPATRPGAGS